ncbi:hypothetical protein T492DRAFT_867080 [Pavlovales sp. CCMP2436]|nr:hypothetical protein T492DRAFT_867080 [Pavlovales sp. CCMP2436]
MMRPISAPSRGRALPTNYTSTYVRDYTPKEAFPGSRRWSAQDFQGRPVPFAYDGSGANTPQRYVSSTTRMLGQYDPNAARVPRRSTADFHGRPAPFAVDGPAASESPDRYVTALQRQFGRERDPLDARFARAPAFNFQGRPVPYALDDADENSERYVSATQRQVRERALGDGHPPERARAPARHGLPYAVHGADEQPAEGSGTRRAGQWSTEQGDSFVTKDIFYEGRHYTSMATRLASDYNPTGA